ncbi:hypothetical protein [Yoonia algicola]|uniref:Tryptophan-rich domain-containing protein n=1 Tax=Yoonia algicola TaxID=3137368 RepID=A0AAN0M562_9RHOB
MALEFIETTGTVGLQQDSETGEYFIVELDESGAAIEGTGTFITREIGGETVNLSDLTYPGYVATQAAADDTPDSTGYKVLFQNAETGDLIIWTVNEDGGYVSDVNVAGDAAAIRATEIGFGVDGLDDVAGIGAEPTNTVIDSTADVALESTASGAYVLNDGVTTFAITRDGAPITDTTYAGYIATQAAADDTPGSDGYKVLFENSDNGDLIIWTVTADGEFVSDVNVAGDAAAIRATEIGFNVDGLDDVEGIGVAPSTDPNTVIDFTADVALESTASGAYVLNDSVTTFAITRDGAPITDTTYAGYIATQAAADDTPGSDGYKVLFENSDNGDLFVWTVTAEGAWVSDVNIAGDAAAIRAAEIGFNVDGLDDVPGIGEEPSTDPNTVIDSTADVALESTASGAYVLNDGVTTFAITRDGAPITDTTYAGYIATQAAADDTPGSDGYKVLFENSDNGDLIIWTVTADGEFVSDVNVAGDAAAIRATEIGFNVDGLDDVEGIGVAPSTDPNTVIDFTADVALESTASGAYVLNDGVTTFAITRDGAPITDTTYAGYIATQAAADDTPGSDGYKVLFENSDNGDLIIWTVTADGEFVSDVNVAGDAAAIRATEIGFNVDGLDDVEGIGVAPSTDPNTVIDSTADVALESTASGAYVLNDGATSFAITRGGTPITNTTYAGYTATQAAADDTPESDGYKVLFQNTETGDLIIWTLDANGNYLSEVNVAGDAAAIRATEIGFNVDGLDDVEGIGAGGENTVIDFTDDVALEITENGGYVLNDGEATFAITRIPAAGLNPIDITDTTYSGFTATQVAGGAPNDGYFVLFQNPDGDLYVWTLTANGQYVSDFNVAGNAEDTRATEIGFNVDGLDDVEGIGATLIEDIGTVTLTEGPTGQYFVNEGTGPVGLTGDNGVEIVPITAFEEDTFIFTAIEAVEDNDEDGGFQILLEVTNASDGSFVEYDVWTFDETGLFEEDAGDPFLFDNFLVV